MLHKLSGKGDWWTYSENKTRMLIVGSGMCVSFVYRVCIILLHTHGRTSALDRNYSTRRPFVLGYRKNSWQIALWLRAGARHPLVWRAQRPTSVYRFCSSWYMYPWRARRNRREICWEEITREVKEWLRHTWPLRHNKKQCNSRQRYSQLLTYILRTVLVTFPRFITAPCSTARFLLQLQPLDTPLGTSPLTVTLN